MPEQRVYAKSKRIDFAGTFDEIEIAGWNCKLHIAQAIKLGTANDAEKAVFSAEIEARGLNETMDEFCGKVLCKSLRFQNAIAMIDGLKRKARNSVSTIETRQEITDTLAAFMAELDLHCSAQT